MIRVGTQANWAQGTQSNWVQLLSILQGPWRCLEQQGHVYNLTSLFWLMLPPKKPRRNPGFLPCLPAGDLTVWRSEQRSKTVADLSKDSLPVRSPHVAGSESRVSQSTGGMRQRRLDMPLVRKRKTVAVPDLQAMATEQGRQDALRSLVDEMYAATSRRPREAQLATWIRFHAAWFGDLPGDPFQGAFPLDQDKILRVSALFKASGYNSYKNYLSRAKDQHLALGYTWNDLLTRISQKCTRSVLRGLSGRVRSEAFDFLKVVSALSQPLALRHEGAPTHPLPMIVTATYFMLRELEVSAIELADITFSADSVSLHLPVSKTDWAAKGCTRTWACLCDRDLPCPFHILQGYVNRIKLEEEVDKSRPLFVSNGGSHCTKDGVVATIRWAADLAGQETVNMEGEQLISGHTFRITGARYLSSIGLDAITVQLLGRWGSDAVLTYLAEAPLQGLANRVKPLAQSGLKREVLTTGEWHENQFDQKANARDALEVERRRRKELHDMKRTVQCLERKCEDLSTIVEGMALAVDHNQQSEIWHVRNNRSFVMHKSLLSLSTAPHTWKTICGWHFSGKEYVTTDRSREPRLDCRCCPKCFDVPSKDAESDTTCSDSSSSN